MRDEIDVKVTNEFVGLRIKAYSYLTDNSNEVRKQKAQKSAS